MTEAKRYAALYCLILTVWCGAVSLYWWEIGRTTVSLFTGSLAVLEGCVFAFVLLI